MFDIFLQLDTASVSAKALSEKSETVFGMLSKGGPIMIPLGILFALAVYIFIERLLVIRKASLQD